MRLLFTRKCVSMVTLVVAARSRVVGCIVIGTGVMGCVLLRRLMVRGVRCVVLGKVMAELCTLTVVSILWLMQRL